MRCPLSRSFYIRGLSLSIFLIKCVYPFLPSFLLSFISSIWVVEISLRPVKISKERQLLPIRPSIAVILNFASSNIHPEKAFCCTWMGIALFPPEDSRSLGADGFKKSGLEVGRVGSVSFKGRDLEKGTIGSFSFKHRKLERIGSVSFKGRDLGTATIRSISFNGRDLEKATIGSISSRGRDLKTATTQPVSFKGRDLETATIRPVSFEGNDLEATLLRSFSFKCSDLEAASMNSNICNSNVCEPVSMGSDSLKEEAAALKLQKVYKSYRTRRNLADCAVVVEELWWKAIDFVTLKRSTVSFFDIEKPETAISRWSRARIKAAKVGKGLSKDDKARKLAFQHWLEAIDPRHRYGHNLHFYYDSWFETDTVQPFFYWLDVGDGRELNLNHCPRSKMQQQCIKYLGPKEREQYEVVVKSGKLVYKHGGQLVDTCKGSKGSKWIFVLSTLKVLYVGQKSKGTFQHSSFLAGGATSAAGRLVVEGGILKSIWPYSGHYLPTEENFNEFINFLEENNVDLTNVQRSPSDEDEPSVALGKEPIIASSANSEVEKEKQHSCKKLEENDLSKECTGTYVIFQELKNDSDLCPDVKHESEDQTGNNFISQQQIGLNQNGSVKDHERHMRFTETLAMDMEGSDTEEVDKTAEQQHDQEQVCYKRSLSDKDLDNQLTDVPHKSLLQRLHSKKSLQSYQLGKQLSFKWSTGAGPRIVCVADYPSELRVKALEKVNLSPRCISLNSPRGSLDLSKQLTSPKIS